MTTTFPRPTPGYDANDQAQTRSIIARAIDALTSVLAAQRPLTAAASPTGSYRAGQFVWNTAPAVVGGKILLGWTCTASGDPATFSPVYGTNS